MVLLLQVLTLKYTVALVPSELVMVPQLTVQLAALQDPLNVYV
jgi:hypothetical protein